MSVFFAFRDHYSKDRKMALIQLGSVEEAIAALIVSPLAAVSLIRSRNRFQLVLLLRLA